MALTDDITEFATNNPLISAIGAGVIGAGVGAAVATAIGAASKGKTRKSRSKSGRSRDARFKSKQKHERRYKRKRKYKIYGKKGWIKPHKRSKSRRGVHYARKTGQPYIILSNGRAKFIKGKRRK